jgi:hypothetical protein
VANSHAIFALFHSGIPDYIGAQYGRTGTENFVIPLIGVTVRGGRHGDFN